MPRQAKKHHWLAARLAHFPDCPIGTGNPHYRLVFTKLYITQAKISTLDMLKKYA